ncbi:MAG: PilT/PilU family type 4a pilus ATPase [Thermodesulfobacteriota bacterium]
MNKADIDHIITRMLESQESISDLNVTVGRPFQVVSSGRLVPVSLDSPIEQITPYQAEIFALHLMGSDARLLKTLVREGSCDFSYQLPGRARFRVNVFQQKGYYSTVMRKLSTHIPTVKELELPESFYKMARERNGVILFTGATGTGKSTSLAAILNEINEAEPVHVITLEDPIEFVHAHRKATFNQRELGADFDSFAHGLRAALRQAPNVVLVGEMRDRETIEIGLSAAETGHLVFSTLHTVDAGQTVNRIIGMFSKDEEQQIRIRLADTVRWVVCQKLLPKVGGGRVAVFEVMNNNVRIKDSILNGESEGKTFYEIIDSGEAFNMQTFDKDILRSYERGLITEETALAYASHRAVVSRGIDQLKAQKGEKTSDIEGLKLDGDYGKERRR